jgi:hypothetical protein
VAGILDAASDAQLTDQGRVQLRRTAPYYLSGIEKHLLALLDTNERRVLAAALERVARHHAASDRATRR